MVLGAQYHCQTSSHSLEYFRFTFDRDNVNKPFVNDELLATDVPMRQFTPFLVVRKVSIKEWVLVHLDHNVW